MKVLQTGNRFDILSNLKIEELLLPGNYEFRVSMTGMYLEKMQDSKSPEKVYSNDETFIAHVIKTWNELDSGNLGLALVGNKGLGKSFTGNQIVEKLNLPVIRVTAETNTEVLLTFLAKLEQDYIIFIDEFEKIFSTAYNNIDDRTSQENFLSFLDGGGNRKNKILFLITANSEHHINSFLKDRPSRLRYFKRYTKLDDSIIKEIIEDLLENQEFGKDLIKFLPYKGLNMDALISIIKEINIHNKPYSEFKDFFNFIGDDTSEIEVTQGVGLNAKKIAYIRPRQSKLTEHDFAFNYRGTAYYFSEEYDATNPEPREVVCYHWKDIDSNDDEKIHEVFLFTGDSVRIQNVVF